MIKFDVMKVKPTLMRSTSDDAGVKALEDEEFKLLYKAQIKKYVDRSNIY